MNRKVVFAALSAYVLLISLLPLLNDFGSVNGWVPYGLGNYRYENNYFYIEVTGLGFSNSKPEISVRPIYLLSTYIPLISIDDSGSYYNGNNLYRDMSCSVRKVNSTALLMRYTDDSSVLSKYIVIRNQSTLTITYHVHDPGNLSVLLELSYLTKLKSTEKVDGLEVLYLRFKDPDNLYKEGKAVLIISNASGIRTEAGLRGVYKVFINAYGKGEVTIKLTRISWPTNVTEDQLFQMSRWLSNERSLHLLYPFTAAAIIYLGWRYWVKREESS